MFRVMKSSTISQHSNQHILQIQTNTDLSLIEVRLGHIVSQTHTLIVTMQPCVVTTGLVRFTWDIYSMMQMTWTMITVTLDTAVIIVIAVLGVQHHPAVRKYRSLTTGKHKQTNKQTNSKVNINWKYCTRFCCDIMTCRNTKRILSI